MTLEEILDQVRAQGREAAAETERETAAKVEQSLAEGRAKAERKREAELAAVDQAIARMKAQELPTAKLALERKKLVMLNELLELVKARALEKLAHLPAKDRRELYKRLYDSAGKLEGTLRCRAADAEELKKLTGCKQLGAPLDEPGFIVEGSQQRLDLRFSTLVEGVWTDHLKEVHTALTGS